MARIIGNTTATPNPQPDWKQIDENKADYIKHKPTILTEEEILALISENSGGGDSGPTADLSGYLTIADAQNTYALKTDIPDVSSFIAEIPDEYVTETELENKKYLTSIPDEYVTNADLEGYAKTEMITYNGTGYYTQDTPASLTFSFSPKIVMILGDCELLILSSSSIVGDSICYDSFDHYPIINFNGNTVEWYYEHDDDEFSFNCDWKKYTAIAIGQKEG